MTHTVLQAPSEAPYCICGNEQTYNKSINGDHVGPLCEPFLTGPLQAAYNTLALCRQTWGACHVGVSADIAFGRSLAERITKLTPLTHLSLHPSEYGHSTYCAVSPENPCQKCRTEGYDMEVDCGVRFYADHATPYWVFDNDNIDTHDEVYIGTVPYSYGPTFLAMLGGNLAKAAEVAWMSDYALCRECGGHYFTPNGPCCEAEREETVFTFTMPCSVSLSGNVKADTSYGGELRLRLARALRDQLADLSDEDLGTLFSEIESE